ncbi:TetR/AcrR family transcriptional regulator [Dinoroseobacter sp. S76]|uniref:TetR/AcrR family transcriptional regulator n=1 Tax=Dinoroseobacter sp. S76 TaxID=3415124 RepID=UPI003C7D5794
MRAETRKQRRAEIEAAAYELLEEKGFAGMSVLSVAQRAKASNGTLYQWYGNKIGLFEALVAGNAAAIRETLERALEDQSAPWDVLARLGPELLGLLLSPRAIALNRAAAADASGALGAALSEAGRGSIAPLITQVIEQAQGQGALAPDPDAAEISDTYLRLLIGDLQIRVVAGHQEPPRPDARTQRAQMALEQLQRLYPA